MIPLWRYFSSWTLFNLQHYNMAHIESDTVEPVPPGILGTQGINANSHAQDEESPLLPRSDTKPKLKALAGVGTIIAVLLLGKEIGITQRPEI